MSQSSICALVGAMPRKYRTVCQPENFPNDDSIDCDVKFLRFEYIQLIQVPRTQGHEQRKKERQRRKDKGKRV